jgi:hypothetical protein
MWDKEVLGLSSGVVEEDWREKAEVGACREV